MPQSKLAGPERAADDSRKVPACSGPAEGADTARRANVPVGASQGIGWRVRLRRDRTLILMTLPAVLLVLVFNYVPLLGNMVAFQDYDPYLGDNALQAIRESPWVGIEHFSRMLEDRLFWQALENTLTIFLVQLTLFFPVPILLALLINSFVRPGSAPSRRRCCISPTSSRGFWSSPSSSRCSAAPACWPRPCASTATRAST